MPARAGTYLTAPLREFRFGACSCDTPLVAAHDALDDLAVVAREPHRHLVQMVQAAAHRRTVHVVPQVVAVVVVRTPNALTSHVFHAPREPHTKVSRTQRGDSRDAYGSERKAGTRAGRTAMLYERRTDKMVGLVPLKLGAFRRQGKVRDTTRVGNLSACVPPS